MPRTQKPITVKLNSAHLAVLDRIVELGDFNGRSHAIREMLMPALVAGATAINERHMAKSKAIFKYGVEMQKLNDHFSTIADRAKKLPRDSKGQGQIELDGIDINLFPELA
jgi:Arc/MetJ-type ribon-helix-helix transcriptional regulator